MIKFKKKRKPRRTIMFDIEKTIQNINNVYFNSWDYPEPDMNPPESKEQIDPDYYEEPVADWDIVTIKE